MKVYFDFADWWVGVYIGPNRIYVCPLPTLVFRIGRRRTRDSRDPMGWLTVLRQEREEVMNSE